MKRTQLWVAYLQTFSRPDPQRASGAWGFRTLEWIRYGLFSRNSWVPCIPSLVEVWAWATYQHPDGLRGVAVEDSALWPLSPSNFIFALTRQVGVRIMAAIYLHSLPYLPCCTSSSTDLDSGVQHTFRHREKVRLLPYRGLNNDRGPVMIDLYPHSRRRSPCILGFGRNVKARRSLAGLRGNHVVDTLYQLISNNIQSHFLSCLM